MYPFLKKNELTGTGVELNVFLLHLGVRLMLSGTVTPNHGYLLLKNIGEGSKALLCITNNTACCSRAQVPGGGILGDWYYPNGTLVPNLLINIITKVYSGISTETEVLVWCV